jgi:hypothetical protein
MRTDEKCLIGGCAQAIIAVICKYRIIVCMRLARVGGRIFVVRARFGAAVGRLPL